MLWWFAQNFIMAAALAVLVRVACLIWRIDPVARHVLWLIVLIKLVTPPLIQWPWPVAQAWQQNIAAPARPVAIRHDIGEPSKAPAPPAVDTTRTPVGTTDAPAETVPRHAVTTVARTDELTAPDTVKDVPGAHAPARAIVERPNVSQSEPRAPIVTGTPPAPIRPQWTDRLRRAATIAWICGSLVFVAIQCVRIARMMRRVSRSLPADLALAQRVAQFSERLQIRPIRLRVVPGISSPAIWAVLRPTLLWPAEMSPDLACPERSRRADRALDGLIVHELAHARRRDHWVGWLELLAGCVWWWNPLFWYVRRQVRENAELACDAWVVDAIPKGRRAYAEALLAVCEQLRGWSVPAPAVGVRSDGRHFLERRLVMILQARFPSRLGRLRMFGALVLALTTLPAWSQKPPESAPGTTTQSAAIAGDKLVTVQVWSLQALPAEAAELLGNLRKDQETTYAEMEARLSRQREHAIKTLTDMATAAAANGSAERAAVIREAIADLVARPDDRVDLADLQVQQDMADAAKLQIDASQADLASKELELKRTEAMFKKNVISANELDRNLLDVKIGKIRVELATREWIQKKDEILAQEARLYQKKRQSLHHLVHGIDGGARDRVKSELNIGSSYDVEVTGSTAGRVWGNGIYTTDSSLSTVAVHCGALKEGERGILTVTMLPGQENYEGAARNGVTSESRGRGQASFVLQKSRAGTGALPAKQ